MYQRNIYSGDFLRIFVNKVELSMVILPLSKILRFIPGESVNTPNDYKYYQHTEYRYFKIRSSPVAPILIIGPIQVMLSRLFNMLKNPSNKSA